MDIDKKMKELVVDSEDTVLHLAYGFDDDDNYIYDELTIPETVEVFISDLSVKKINIPKKLRVLDLYPTVMTNLDFNLSSTIQDIIIRSTNIVNKSIMELFPKNCRYRYNNCYLNDTPIYLEINKLYKKYFNQTTKISLNLIYYRTHSSIIEEIRTYQDSIIEKKKICKLFKEELAAKLYHPDRVFRLIETYGIDILDEI